MNARALVTSLQDAGQDFEWYPTTARMIHAVRRRLDDSTDSILDVGAGDGRVLAQLAEKCTRATLYAIEKAPLLQRRQPEAVIPVGTEFYEQDLMSLPVDVLFSNPPYLEFEEWAARIIETAHASLLFLVLPQRWEESTRIAAAVAARDAKVDIIHRDDFEDADRRSRAVVHIVRVKLQGESRWGSGRREDPFDRWFDTHIDTFDREETVSDSTVESRVMARLHRLDSINGLVDAFDEDYARMQANYKAIFQLDYALFKELGVNKHTVREGLKKRMQGLKHTYWTALFEHLDVITSRLTTATKKQFLDRLNGQKAIAFTASNAYAVVQWAIRYANQYFDRQLVDLFRALSTHEGAENYVSNQRAWVEDRWRYQDDQKWPNTHYKLDYRVVKHHYAAMGTGASWRYEYPGNLHMSSHELLDDMAAVFSNLGFVVRDVPSRQRAWVGGQWQDFKRGDEVVFQAKAYQNGNVHIRILPAAIKALNIEAARLLGWVRGPADVVEQMGYTPADAERYYGANQQLGATAVRLLSAGGAQA